jgi:hypothetical protein
MRTPLDSRTVERPGDDSRIPVDPQGVASLMPAIVKGELPTYRDVFLQALLHLPRIAYPDGTIDEVRALAEIARIRAWRAAELEPVRGMAQPPPKLPQLDQLSVQFVPRPDAEPIVSRFHYLRSFREDSTNLAAIYKHRIVALCSISPLDLQQLGRNLPIDSAQQVAVISRVFAFDWAPRNVLSYLLSRAQQSRVVGEEVRLLLTYLNPHMGFTGASYKAANWQRLGIEFGTRHAYLRGRYITDRRLARLSTSELREVEFSRMPLKPLLILGRFLDRRLTKEWASGRYLVVARESPTGESTRASSE